MNHLTEEQLVDFYYGERAGNEEHLRECAECSAEYEKICRTLHSVSEFQPPAPRVDFEADLWRNIQPRIQARPIVMKRRPTPMQVFGLVGAIAAMLVVAFLAGRVSKPAPQVAQDRMGVLALAVGDHLERMEAVFEELQNANPKGGRIDISFEQASAEDLLDSNRLYRQTALASGDLATASVLEDLELALLDVAHRPSSLSAGELADLRNQISDRGVLFKARVLAGRLRVEQMPQKQTREKQTKENRS